MIIYHLPSQQHLVQTHLIIPRLISHSCHNRNQTLVLTNMCLENQSLVMNNS